MKRVFKKEIEETKIPEFKKVTDSGYEKIKPINDNWSIPIQVGFTRENEDARIMIPETELFGDNLATDFVGEIEIKKGFSRVYFEKKGAGYSSVAGDYYIPTLTMPVVLKINDFGEQVVIQRKNGYKVSYVDSVINAAEYISEELWNKLSEDDRIYLLAVDTASLRADLIEYLNTVPRSETPFNFALFELNQNYNLFQQITEDVYIDVPTNQWEDADIELTIGQTVFVVNKYAVVCKNEANEEEFGFMIFFDFGDELIKELGILGYKKIGG